MSRHVLALEVNGMKVRAEVDAATTLVAFLREELGLTGTKEGCGNGECGACTVLVDGVPMRSCLLLAVEVDGKSVTTIEGLARGGKLDVVQQAFVDAGAVQCGYCLPGFVMAAAALLKRHPEPTDEQISEAFGGHLCRCAIYPSYFEAVRLAAKRMASGPEDGTSPARG